MPIIGADGELIEWVGVHTDITEQRAAEQALRDQALASPFTDHIVFVGRVPHDQVEHYYAQVDVLAYPRKAMRLLLGPPAPLAEVELALSERGQCLAFEPPYFGTGATVGGMVAALVVPTMGHPDKIIDQDITTTLSEIHRLIVMVLFVTVLVMSALAAAGPRGTCFSSRTSRPSRPSRRGPA